MLNDISGFTRLAIFLQMLPLGLFLGVIPFVGETRVWAICFGLGLLLEIVWCVGVVVATRRFDVRIKRMVTAASSELVGTGPRDTGPGGTVPGTPVFGRVVRSRRAKGYDAFLIDPGRVAEAAEIVVFTAIGDGVPRRVAALVPAALKLPPGQSALLLAHPEHREAAVLESRATPAHLDGAANDPRWRTEKLPTDRSVVGGWSTVLAAGLAGAVVGGLVALGIGAALS